MHSCVVCPPPAPCHVHYPSSDTSLSIQYDSCKALQTANAFAHGVPIVTCTVAYWLHLHCSLHNISLARLHIRSCHCTSTLCRLVLKRCSPLQMGKVHFGIILGWSVVQSMVLYFVVNQIASNEGSQQRALDLYSCCCITGYGMVPLLIVSIAVLLVPRWVAETSTCPHLHTCTVVSAYL